MKKIVVLLSIVVVGMSWAHFEESIPKVGGVGGGPRLSLGGAGEGPRLATGSDPGLRLAKGGRGGGPAFALGGDGGPKALGACAVG